MDKIKFYTSSIKKVDLLNLDVLIIYNSKMNSILEYHFCSMKDPEDIVFVYQPEVSKTRAVALKEEWVLKDLRKKIDSGKFALLEGDLAGIEKAVYFKTMVEGLIHEVLNAKN